MSACCGCLDPLSRRSFITALCAAVTAACAGPTVDGTTRREDALTAQARAALRKHPVIDLHAHPGGFISSRVGEVPIRALEEMTAGGVDAAFFAAVGDNPVIQRYATGIKNFRDPRPGELYASSVTQLERVLARAREGRVVLVREPGDIAAARTTGVRAALATLEGGDGLEGRVERVREFHAMGVRAIQLMHYRVNELGDIQTEPPRYGRLTDAGAAVVAEMNRLKMVVDGAHAARATLLGILDVARAPIIVSHTGPNGLRRNARHLDDDLLRAVAAKGGVIGVWPLTSTGRIDTFLTEIAYVRDIVGVDHVGVGTDMAGMATFTSIPTYREFAPVPAALLARGFSESDLAKVLGGNVLRVFEAVSDTR
jgi:membrane dipeptidase